MKKTNNNFSKQNSLVNVRGKELALIPQESVWMANFTSKNTKATYSVSVRDFFHFHLMKDKDQNDLHSSTQAHVISWHDAIENTGHAPQSINSYTLIRVLPQIFKFH